MNNWCRIYFPAALQKSSLFMSFNDIFLVILIYSSNSNSIWLLSTWDLILSCFNGNKFFFFFQLLWMLNKQIYVIFSKFSFFFKFYGCLKKNWLGYLRKLVSKMLLGMNLQYFPVFFLNGWFNIGNETLNFYFQSISKHKSMQNLVFFMETVWSERN